MSSVVAKDLRSIYQQLFSTFGPQSWWPGDTPFEIIIGAILTQNTNWTNVEKAIQNLKKDDVLSPRALSAISPQKLAALIKPSGYFNVKAKRIKNFIQFLFSEYDGDLQRMKKEPLSIARKKLLAVNGIGPETADSILLYALDKPVFVIDAYTKRIFYRHNLVSPKDDYHQVQKLFADNLAANRKMFNEYHALIVRLGKEFCKPTPNCASCPLHRYKYSLIYKCGACHRFLPGPSERRSVSTKNKEGHTHSQYSCQTCYALPKS